MAARFTSPSNPAVFNALVWEIVRQIPAGKVSTYGQIAAMILPPQGMTQHDYGAFGARWVGGAMAACPEGIPWQRVINSQGKIYIGQTRNLAARVAQHNDPEYRSTLHTKRHSGPWRLLYQEQLGTRQAVMRRERELKSNRGREWIRGLPQVGQSAD